jgi:predicted ArsR family transcriptional regulator
MGAVRGPDLVALDVLPGSASHVAAALGVTHATATDRLHRLERAGLAERGETVPSGPRGGRPEIIWKAT